MLHLVALVLGCKGVAVREPPWGKAVVCRGGATKVAPCRVILSASQQGILMIRQMTTIVPGLGLHTVI